MVRLNNSVGKSKIKNSKSSKNQIKNIKTIREIKQINSDGVFDINNSSIINKIEVLENIAGEKNKDDIKISNTDNNSNNILNNIKKIQLNNRMINLNFNRNKKRRINLEDLRDRKNFQNNFENEK